MANIKYLWFLVTITLVVSSCSGVRSVRNTKYLQNLKTESNKKNENIDLENKIEELNSTPKENFTENQIIQQEPENYSKLASIIGSRLPTLREQMDQISSTQDSLKTDISAIQGDIKEIKNLISDLRESIEDYAPQTSKLPYTGNPKNNTVLEDKSAPKNNVLKSDETNNINYQSPKIPKNKVQIEKKAIAETFMKSDESVISKKNQITKKISDSPSVLSESKNESSKSGDFSKFKIGKEFFTNKKYYEAIENLNDALENETSKKQESEINYLLGESYYFIGNFDKSSEHMNKVINSGASQFIDGARLRKAEANLKSGKVNEAKSDYQLLIKNHPTSNYVPLARKMLQQL